MRLRVPVLLAIVLALVVGLPALATAGVPVEPGAAVEADFLPSSGCGCHATLVGQWSVSMHAQAITDPVFLAKVAEAEAAAGPEVALFCKRCHSPIGNMLADFDGTKTKVAAEGVACMFCHQVVAVNGEPANVAHLLEPDLTRRAQLKEPQAPHPAAYSEIHEKAEFCGGCHNVNHPTNGTHLETSYAEWAASPYATEGVVCQDCHMSEKVGLIGPSPGTAAAGGPQRDNIYSMTFVGANVAQGPADASRALLQSAATMEMDLVDIVPPSTSATFTVGITNKGAGHYLPTGLTEVREMWLRVYAEAEDGTITEIGERRFGTILKDAAGDYPAEMWEAVAIHSDDRIPPRETVTSTYAFEMPTGAERITVRAVLNYRSVSETLATTAGVENPVTEMAVAETTVYASEEAKQGEPAAEETQTPAPEPEPAGTPWWAIALGVVALLAFATYLIMRGLRAKPE